LEKNTRPIPCLAVRANGSPVGKVLDRLNSPLNDPTALLAFYIADKADAA